MFWAAEAASSSTTHFDPFDAFIIVFTLIIALAVVRTITAKQKNLLAIAFSVVSLLVFLVMDYVMVQNWMS
ncbi:DUF2759 family protein [Paenibacillus sp. MBLB4367]|uniref:DUF2759 family protein n=1 Tax=Paenibacillus sp. MBLB4367 TaxID=3384767 RepID=UPI003907F308